MKLKTDLFPYPVLYKELDDYVSNSSFTTEIKPMLTEDNSINLHVEFNLTNNEIKRRIEKGDFSYAVHVECGLTSFRKLYIVDGIENTIDITLSNRLISDKVEINTMIITNRQVNNYHNKDFNPLYYSQDYVVPQLSKGEIIAHDTVSEMNIKFKNRENPNAKSMIRVSAKNEEYMSVNLEGDYIQIYLPKKAHIAYKALSKSNEVNKNLLLVTIVQPTLMYIIDQLASNKLIVEDLQWYSALKNILENKGYDIYNLENIDSLKISQELLEKPMENALYDFYEWGNEDV
ncbi:hypothetical protein [Staphylococcus simulans]|uniref:hypothetical protein n=1 Tax=Staphylococcus simulans TaxID=1286 RepID=UPI0021D29F2E|nr:hypothetical protein [Staphylococcus simulans]UXV37757.1 hypothetical protein MUA87_01070 [Staphylococcus simulans]UXV40205.1 hypothetical protein MUA56_01070 [Staphylococcus simulans]